MRCGTTIGCLDLSLKVCDACARCLCCMLWTSHLRQLTASLGGMRVLMASAGRAHTAICTEDGVVYTWGRYAHNSERGGQRERNKEAERQRHTSAFLSCHTACIAAKSGGTSWQGML